MQAIIGVDIGGMSIKACAVCGDKLVTKKQIYATPPADIFGQEISKIVKDVLVDAEKLGYCIKMVGLGCPGIVSQNGVVLFSNNLGLENYPLKEIVEKETGFKVSILNDAFCATLAEFKYGSGKDCHNMTMFTIGTGVGCGLILNDELYMGRNSCTAGGHIVIRGGYSPCNCGGNGCMETRASITALLKTAKAYAIKYGEENLYPANFGGKEVFNMADDNIKSACKAKQVFIKGIGDGIISICNLLRPEKIVLGGGISARGEALTKPLTDYVTKHIYIKKGYADFSIECAKLGNDAGIIGACEYAKKIFKEL